MDIPSDIKYKLSILSGLKSISLHSSGTNALFKILKLLELEKDAAVMIPNFSCERLLLPFLNLNIKFILVDNSPYSATPSLLEYQRVFNPNVKVILLVYPWGYVPSDLLNIITWAKLNNLVIIEDIASALGLSFQGNKLGTLGDYAFGSFGNDKFCSLGRIGFSGLSMGDSLCVSPVPKNSLFKGKYNYLIKILRKKTFHFLRPIFLLLFSRLPHTFYENHVVTRAELNLLRLKIAGYSKEIKLRRTMASLYIKNLEGVNYLRILQPNNDQSVALRLLCVFESPYVKNKIIKTADRNRVWIGRDYSVPLNSWVYGFKKNLNRSDYLGKRIINLVTSSKIENIKNVIKMLRATQT